MRGRYEASQDLLGTLRKQLSDSEGERRALEEQLQRLRDKTDEATQAQEDAQREAQRLRSSIDLLSRCPGGQSGGAEKNQCLGLMPARAVSMWICTSMVLTSHVCLLKFKSVKHFKN